MRFLTLDELRNGGGDDLSHVLTHRLKLEPEEETVVLAEVLSWAEDRLVSLVSTRVPEHDLPSTPGKTPPLVKGLVLDLALMRLGETRLNVTLPGWAARGSRAMHHLNAVAAGRANLVLPSAPPSDNPRPTVAVVQDPDRPRLDRGAANRGMLIGRSGR